MSVIARHGHYKHIVLIWITRDAIAAGGRGRVGVPLRAGSGGERRSSHARRPEPPNVARFLSPPCLAGAVVAGFVFAGTATRRASSRRARTTRASARTSRAWSSRRSPSRPTTASRPSTCSSCEAARRRHLASRRGERRRESARARAAAAPRAARGDGVLSRGASGGGAPPAFLSRGACAGGHADDRYIRQPRDEEVSSAIQASAVAVCCPRVVRCALAHEAQIGRRGGGECGKPALLYC